MCTYCLWEFLGGPVHNLFHQPNGHFELLIAQARVALPVENLIHLRKTEVLEAKDAFDVVIGHEDAVHSAHAHLERVLQHGSACHVVEFAFKRLPLALRVAQLIAESLLVLFMVHANRHNRPRLQVEDAGTGQSRIVGVKL